MTVNVAPQSPRQLPPEFRRDEKANYLAVFRALRQYQTFIGILE